MSRLLTYGVMQQKRKITLGFNPFVAPTTFDPTSQPVNIYSVFDNYYKTESTARYIYSFTSAISTLTLAAVSGISYRWGETISGVDYVNDITSGTAFTSGSTNRYVIVKSTSTSLNVLLPVGAVWLYLGNFSVSSLAGGTTTVYGTYLTYIHCHDLNCILKFNNSAFRNSNLTGELTLPNTDIVWGGDRVFSGCAKITGIVTISENITSVGGYAFSGCTGLTGIIIGINCETIYYNAFENCNNVTSLTFGGSELTIDANAFFNLSKLTGTLTIPSTVQTIGSSAFHNCQYSGTLTIPSTVTTIGAGAFALNLFDTIVSNASNFIVDDISGTSCDVLYDVTGGTKCEANYSARAGVTALIFRSDTTKILDSCSQNNSLKTGGLIIPSTVTYIGTNAFLNCSELTEVFPTIPAATLTIGGSAFQSCSKLTGNLVIPNTVTSLGGSAFASCSGLDGTLTIGTGISSLAYGVFWNCSKLNGNISIPNNITSVGQNAFRNDAGFTGTLTLSENTTSYTTYVFDGVKCSGILNLPANLSSISSNNWGSCTFSRINAYRMTAPSIPSNPFGNYGCELHIKVGATGYNVAPWTTTAIFSSIIADL